MNSRIQVQVTYLHPICLQDSLNGDHKKRLARLRLRILSDQKRTSAKTSVGSRLLLCSYYSPVYVVLGKPSESVTTLSAEQLDEGLAGYGPVNMT